MQKFWIVIVFVFGLTAGALVTRLIQPEPAAGGASWVDDQSKQAGMKNGLPAGAGAAMDRTHASAPETEPAALDALTLDQKIARIDELKLTASLENSIKTLEIIDSMSEPEIEAMLQQMGKRGLGSMDDWLMPYHLFTAWVEKNPQNAFKFLEEESNPMQRQMYSSSLFSAWAATDPDGALAAIEQIDDKQKRDQAFSAVAMAIAGKDPNRAFELLNSRDDTNPWQYQTVFMFWAGQDVDAAMAKVNTMEPGNARTNALSGMINGMATKDVDRAAKFAMTLEREDEREQALQTVMQVWINQDLEAAIQFIDELEPGNSKNSIIQNSIYALARADPERALQFAETEMTGRAQDDAVSNVIRQMAREQPEKAAELVASLPFGRVYSNSVRAIAQQWGSEDPVAALAWAETLEAGEESDRAYSSILSAFASGKPKEAERHLDRMAAGENRVELAGYIADNMAQDRPREALLWAESLADEAAVERASESAVAAWAARDPVAVLAHLQANGGADAIAKHVGPIANNWAQQDLEGAAAWALGLEGKAQESAVNSISREWLDHNTEEASIWIADLEVGPARDDAVRNLVNKVYRSDASSALAWAVTIENERTRTYSARRAIRELESAGRSDEARDSVQSSSLDDAAKEKLLELLD